MFTLMLFIYFYVDGLSLRGLISFGNDTPQYFVSYKSITRDTTDRYVPHACCIKLINEREQLILPRGNQEKNTLTCAYICM